MDSTEDAAASNRTLTRQCEAKWCVTVRINKVEWWLCRLERIRIPYTDVKRISLVNKGGQVILNALTSNIDQKSPLPLTEQTFSQMVAELRISDESTL